MCEFVSWVEHKGKVYFLTDRDLETRQGRDVIVYCGANWQDDIKGHGAIREYYGIAGGTDHECTDFSDSDNFPPEIVEAIKEGQFRFFGVALGVLTESALVAYEEVQNSALAAYEEVQKPAWLAAYEAIKKSTFWALAVKKDNRTNVWQ